MKPTAFLVILLSFSSCGNDARIAISDPLTLSGQINDYPGGEKTIRSSLIRGQPVLGKISDSGAFLVTIPTDSMVLTKGLIYDYSRCIDLNGNSEKNPLEFGVFSDDLQIYPSDVKDSTLEGTLFQSTCNKAGCSFPENNFRVRRVYAFEAKNLKNYTCTINVRFPVVTFNFDLDLKPGWNVFRFITTEDTNISKKFKVENYNGFEPNWNISPPGFPEPMSK